MSNCTLLNAFILYQKGDKLEAYKLYSEIVGVKTVSTIVAEFEDKYNKFIN
jgi:hypothetical protein